MKLFLQRFLNRRNACYIVCAVFIISMIPLFLIAMYNHPCADDYSYGAPAAVVWREDSSFGQTVSAALKNVKSVYDTWQGTFSAIFLMSLHPAVFGEQLYAWVPILLLIGFIAATLFLSKVVLINYLKMDKYGCFIIALLLTFLSIQFVFSPAQAFFWYNGGMYYTGFHSLALVLFGLVLLALQGSRRVAPVIYTGLAVMLAFFIGGGNYVTALTSATALALLALYRLICKKGKWLIPLLALAALCAGLFISATAPGNAFRQEFFHNMSPLNTIWKSFGNGIWFLFRFLSIPVLLGFACMAPLIYGIAQKCGYSFRLPGVATLLAFGVYSSSFTPTLYAMSSFGADRVVNVNQYTLYIFVLFLMFYWSGWLAKRIAKGDIQIKTSKHAVAKRKVQVQYITALAAVGLVASCLLSVTNGQPIAGISAARSLISGEAVAYHKELLAREALYKDEAIRRVEVPPLSVRPHVLFFDDITTDPGDWRNTSLASYYGKQEIILSQD